MDKQIGQSRPLEIEHDERVVHARDGRRAFVVPTLGQRDRAFGDDQRAVARDRHGVARPGGDAGEPDRRGDSGEAAGAEALRAAQQRLRKSGDDLDRDVARRELRLPRGGRGRPEAAAVKHGAAPPWDRRRRPARCAPSDAVRGAAT